MYTFKENKYIYYLISAVCFGLLGRFKDSIEFYKEYLRTCGPGSLVDIANDYGLDVPGIESRWGRDFPRLSIQALGPTQPPVRWVPGLSGGKVRPGCAADHSPPSSAEVMEE
jgi:hypothetical protein